MINNTASSVVPGVLQPYFPPPPCLIFEEESGADFTFQMSAKGWGYKTDNSSIILDGTLETSVDAMNWTEYNDVSTTVSSVNGKLYLRGSGINIFSSTNPSAIETTSTIQLKPDTARIKCTGNIETLLDWQIVANGEHPIMSSYCFRKLFQDCKALITAPDLSTITTLSPFCYINMFSGCSSLETVSETLPAEKFNVRCYAYMFSSCTSLVIAPKIAATDVTNVSDNDCCYGMFSDCSSLIQGPNELLSQTIPANCYREMFKNCILLETAPEILAQNLDNYCCKDMFYNCSSLTKAPSELPATNLSSYCYQNMFNGCTSLITPPKILATTLADYCCNCMFQNCTSLSTLPKLYAKTVKLNYCYSNMFNGCTSIKLSTTKTGEYQLSYRIPFSGTGQTDFMNMSNMFANTGGTFTSNPSINTTYYTPNPSI